MSCFAVCRWRRCGRRWKACRRHHETTPASWPPSPGSWRTGTPNSNAWVLSDRNTWRRSMKWSKRNNNNSPVVLYYVKKRVCTHSAEQYHKYKETWKSIQRTSTVHTYNTHTLNKKQGKSENLLSFTFSPPQLWFIFSIFLPLDLLKWKKTTTTFPWHITFLLVENIFVDIARSASSAVFTYSTVIGYRHRQLLVLGLG